MNRILLLVCGFLLVPLAGWADELLVEESGVWSSTAPVTIWSAPDESWSYSFEVANQPAITAFDLGNYFEVPFTNFIYILGGEPVSIAPENIAFFNLADAGLIDVTFAGAVFVAEGPQAYLGPETSPTILPGVYPLSSSSYFFSQGNSDQPLSGSLTIIPAPEPTTAAMLLVVFVVMAVRFRNNSRQPELPRSCDRAQPGPTR